jgi:hypothetical protein
MEKKVETHFPKCPNDGMHARKCMCLSNIQIGRAAFFVALKVNRLDLGAECGVTRKAFHA